MPARKAPITLATTASSGADLIAEASRKRTDVAVGALRAYQRGVAAQGHRMPDVPTPERLQRAKGEARVEHGTEPVVTYDEHNEPTVKRQPVVRMRVSDSTIEILARRRLLSRDPERNLAYLKAARQLLQDWLDAGLSAIGSVDFERDVRKGAPPQLFKSEHQVAAFEAYHDAMLCLTPDERSIVHAIVIEELPVAMAGQKMLEYRGTKQAQAAALALLRNGAVRLSCHYGLSNM